MTQRQPAAYQCRMKTTREGSEWRNWHEISPAEYEIYSANPGPNAFGVIREVRPLFDMTEASPKLTVWCGPMPESNGKSNFTAILRRVTTEGLLGDLSNGITIARSEYPGRVMYEADRMRFLIGELAAEPFILDYDAEKHSGYEPPAVSLARSVKALEDHWVNKNGGYHPDHTVEQWVEAVKNNVTRAGYWAWVQEQINMSGLDL